MPHPSQFYYRTRADLLAKVGVCSWDYHGGDHNIYGATLYFGVKNGYFEMAMVKLYGGAIHANFDAVIAAFDEGNYPYFYGVTGPNGYYDDVQDRFIPKDVPAKGFYNFYRPEVRNLHD